MKENTEQEKDIAVVFQGSATKANGSALGFEVGRERNTDSLFLRVVSNDGGGTFTKAWQSVAAVRQALASYEKEKKGLRFAQALDPAIPQKGRNNAPFVGYILLGIGILSVNVTKPGEYFVAGDWKEWQNEMLALPVPEPPPPPVVEPPAQEPTEVSSDSPATTTKQKAVGKKQKAATSTSSTSESG